MLANPDDTVCDFNVYQGETTFPEENAVGFGLRESAVLHLTRTLVPGHIIHFGRYFTSAEGVDSADRMFAVCPSRARTKKWTMRFISHMLDLAASNAWILYNNISRK